MILPEAGISLLARRGLQVVGGGRGIPQKRPAVVEKFPLEIFPMSSLSGFDIVEKSAFGFPRSLAFQASGWGPALGLAWGPDWGPDVRQFRTRRGRVCFAILEGASVLKKDSPRAGLFFRLYKGDPLLSRGLCPLIPGGNGGRIPSRNV